MIDVRDYGAVGDGVFDNFQALQRAVNDALTARPGEDSTVYIPAGRFLVSAYSVTPAWFNFTTSTFSAVPNGTVTFQGAGQNQTFVVAGQQFNYTGIIGYGRSGANPQIAQFNASDLTFDGNYNGAGGAVAQPTTAPGALISLPWPGTSASVATRTGRYHTFTRCRFYRATGYGFQPTQGVRLIGCELDTLGQPDKTLHYDNLGSGPGDAIVTGCNWHDSSGNYADFISGSPAFIRLVMTGCTSFNHGLGGIYACGTQSVITGNSLSNNTAGAGVGYDSGTAAANRSRNVVSGNCLVNIALGGSGLSASSYGDLFAGLNSSDG